MFRIFTVMAITSGSENPLNGDPKAEPINDLAGVEGTELKLSGASSAPNGNLIGVKPED